MGSERLRYCALWQEQLNNYLDYRVQTNDPQIARKLRRREKTMIAGFGMNSPLWIFCLQYASLKSAKRGLNSICGPDYGPLEKDASTGGFIAYTRTILTSKSGLESG